MGHEVTADRLTGVLIGAACADALGAGYEFGRPVPPERPVTMRGQGMFLNYGRYLIKSHRRN